MPFAEGDFDKNLFRPREERFSPDFTSMATIFLPN